MLPLPLPEAPVLGLPVLGLPVLGLLVLGLLVLGLLVLGLLPMPLELGLDEVPPLLELPLVMPSSCRHFSRSVPTMPRHLLLLAPELLLGELVLGELELLGELALLGELLLDVPPEDALPELLLSEELLPVVALGLELEVPLLPVVALGLELDAPVLPLAPPADPADCASETPASAKSAAAVAAVMSFSFIRVLSGYLVVLEPPVEPEPVPEPLEPEPDEELPGVFVLLPLLPLPLEPDAPLPIPLLEPLLPPDEAPEPDLKYWSHSWREICPSLFLSTLENEGDEELEEPADELGELLLDAPPEALGEDELLLGEDELLDAPPDALGEDELELGEDELLDEPPEALGEEELDEEPPDDALPEDDLLSVALGLELLDAPPLELCACATPASANSAADVAVTTTFNIIWNSS